MRHSGEVWWLPEGKAHAQFWVVSWTSFFVALHVYLQEQLTCIYHGYSDLGISRHFLDNERSVAAASSKTAGLLLLCTLPMIKLELSNDNQLEFWKTCICHCELDSFLIKTFLMRSSSLTQCNKVSFLRGGCYIWDVSALLDLRDPGSSLWTSVFQWPISYMLLQNHACVKDPLQCKVDQWLFTSQSRKHSLLRRQSPYCN